MTKDQKWDRTCMIQALAASRMSHCTRYKVGCIIVVDRRPIVTGINGTAPDQMNCDEVFPDAPSIGEEGYEDFKAAHGVFSHNHEHHAEANAIDWCAKKGCPTEGATIYSTLSTCIPCAKTMIAAGIKRFVYLEEYDRGKIDAVYEGLKHLSRAGVEIEHLNPETLFGLNQELTEALQKIHTQK